MFHLLLTEEHIQDRQVFQQKKRSITPINLQLPVYIADERVDLAVEYGIIAEGSI